MSNRRVRRRWRLWLLGLLAGAPGVATAGTPHLSARYVGVPLAAAVSDIAARVGAALEWQGNPPATPVSIELTEVSFDEALDRLLRPRSYVIVTAGRSHAARRIVVMPNGETPAIRPTAGGAPAAAPDAPDALAALDATDPAGRRRLLEQARGFDPHDARRQSILAGLVHDDDPTLRTAAAALAAEAAALPYAPHDPDAP